MYYKMLLDGVYKDTSTLDNWKNYLTYLNN